MHQCWHTRSICGLVGVALFASLFGIHVSKSTGQVATEAPPEVSTEQRVSQIRELLMQYHDYGQLNGAVLVAEDGRAILREGFGMANMEWDIPIRPDTKFRIGSVTKQFTAALVLLLVEDGKIDLQAPVTTYLPDYRKETGDTFTTHHLLCHTSGVPSYTTPEFFEKYSRDSYELDEFVKRFASGDLEFEPGSQYRYSNSGYHLLGAIIESVAEKSYADVLQERILTPVGMTDSGFDVSATVLKNRAQGYSKTAGGFVNADYLDMGIPYSAGSMYSTVNDLLKWDIALREDRVLSAESKKLMYTPNLGGYGYGVDIGEHKLAESDGSSNVTRLISHGGGIHGFNCLLVRAVDQKRVVAILDNVGMGRYHRDISTAILNILNDQPFDSPKISIANALAEVVDEGGAAVAARYRSLKQDHPAQYNFNDEQALNNIGYWFLGEDKVADAIEVFKLNVELFPKSFNPYDSLGEAYLKDGQTELALTNYKKSLELHPTSETGLLAIQKIEGSAPKIDPEVLRKYEGKYQVPDGPMISITFEDGELKGQPEGQEEVSLESLTETRFIVPSIQAKVDFLMDEGGNVNSLKLQHDDQEVEAKKVP